MDRQGPPPTRPCRLPPSLLRLGLPCRLTGRALARRRLLTLGRPPPRGGGAAGRAAGRSFVQLRDPRLRSVALGAGAAGRLSRGLLQLDGEGSTTAEGTKQDERDRRREAARFRH